MKTRPFVCLASSHFFVSLILYVHCVQPLLTDCTVSTHNVESSGRDCYFLSLLVFCLFDTSWSYQGKITSVEKMNHIACRQVCREVWRVFSNEWYGRAQPTGVVPYLGRWSELYKKSDKPVSLCSVHGLCFNSWLQAPAWVPTLISSWTLKCKLK